MARKKYSGANYAAAKAKQDQDARLERVAAAQKTLGIYKPSKQEIVKEQNDAFWWHLKNSDRRMEAIADKEDDLADRSRSKIEKAQANFRAGQYHIATTDPGRNSPITNRAIIAAHNAEVSRAEAAAARELEAKTRIAEAEAKRDGMIGQGRDAAHAQWGQMIDGKFVPGGAAAIAELNRQGELERAKLSEGWTDEQGVRHQGSKEIVSAGENAARKELGAMQFGAVGPDGTVTPGANERVETIRGNSAVRQQEETNKGLLAQAEMQRQAKADALAAQIEKATIAAGGQADKAKIAANAKIISSAINAGAAQGKDATVVLGELREKYKNDPEMSAALKAVGGGDPQQKSDGPKEGDRKKFADGEAVFKNGRWEKI